MLDESDPPPDWRRAETYGPLLNADAERWAWEFARRATAAVETVPTDCFVAAGPAEDPAPAVIWAWRSDPAMPVLWVRPAEIGQPRALNLRTVNLPVLVLRDAVGDQHVMVCDRSCRLRFAVVEGDVLAGPVEAAIRVPAKGVAACGEALKLLAGLRDRGRLAPATFRPSTRAMRWIETLRAHDARRDGASQRDIALALFGERRVREDWTGGSDYMRMRVHRLLTAAEALVAGGYRRLLGAAQPESGEATRMVEIWRSPRWLAP